MSLTLLIAQIVIELFGPNPRIVVSERTTVITSPLAEDGLPNYQDYWLNYGREGVTFENNAAVPFWQAIWPGELSQRHWLPMSQALGFERVPSPTNRLQDPYSSTVRGTLGFWLTEHFQRGLAAAESDRLLTPENQKLITGQSAEAVVGRAMSRPWTGKEIPPLADWVAGNAEPFALLHEAASRPKWWSPSPSLLDEPYEGAIYILLPGVQSLRGATRALSIRAMWYVGEGHPEEAWLDLKASFQLARLCGKGVTLVEQLVAIAMDTMTCQRTATLLHHSRPDAKFARKVLDYLTTLAAPSDVKRAIDEGERIFFPDLIVSGLRHQIDVVDLGIGTPSIVNLDYFDMVKINWNYVLRKGTLWYDRLAASLDKPTRAERSAALAQDRADLVQLGVNIRKPNNLVAAAINSNARSALVGDLFVSLMVSALDASTKAEDRSRTWLDLTRIAAALAVYRAENGDYPEQLDQLVPGVLAKVPTDLYTGMSFHYERRTDGGYLLYSLYENGMDDGGTDIGGEIVAGDWYVGPTEGMPSGASDLVIRVPVPEFELPAAPKFVE